MNICIKKKDAFCNIMNVKVFTVLGAMAIKNEIFKKDFVSVAFILAFIRKE